MPTYEFRCPVGHEFERFYRSIGSAQSISECPTCGVPAERMMSATGFAFKGSGFYLTDYGKNAHRGEAPPGDKASEGSDGGDTSPATDAKAEGPASDSGKAATADAEGGKKTDAKAGESKPAAKAEPKAAEAKPKAADATPAPSRPKPSANE